ncbi:MAG: diphosphomevalonate decarboxylase [Chloroflexi bacterium]|nr:diphosphomevalonate decarboxylase [Chloroflexota bacterium]MBI5712918.1 diphosphomevalonate decarboxylase [Chloroflexota bacterium]
MQTGKASARANSNIAYIKYWGNCNNTLRLPSNSSLSMNLDGLHTQTTVTFESSLNDDEVIIENKTQSGVARERVIKHLNLIRDRAKMETRARVESENNFPTGAGIASSASAFAALTTAACAAAHLQLSERELSIIARMGSGSASRSVPTGFVEWYRSERHDESFAESIAPPEYWNLVDCVAIVSAKHKEVGSTDGHSLANTSPLQQARVEDAPRRLKICKEALLKKDFARFADIVEEDAVMMHAIMMTSRPPLFYWLPPTLTVMGAVKEWRTRDGIPVCFTIDAGANVHVITLSDYVSDIESRLRAINGVQDVLKAKAGEGARVMKNEQ